MSATKLFLIVVLAVVVAAMVVNVLSGGALQRERAAPTYEIVPCSEYPWAHGCEEATP